MKLFLVKRKDKVGYDQVRGFVIRAESILAARELAADNHAEEGAAVWTDQDRSSCLPIKEDGAQEVLLLSFRAG